MVGARAVIAQGFRRVGTHEDSARVLHQRQQALRVGNGQLQVFRRQPVGDRHCLVDIARPDQRSPSVEGLANDVGALHLRQQPLDAGGDGVEVGAVG